LTTAEVPAAAAEEDAYAVLTAGTPVGPATPAARGMDGVRFGAVAAGGATPVTRFAAVLDGARGADICVRGLFDSTQVDEKYKYFFFGLTARQTKSASDGRDSSSDEVESSFTPINQSFLLII
jgi:hypothetical protein